MLKLTALEAKEPYQLLVGFNDGRSGVADLSALICAPGSAFTMLEGPELFRSCRIESGAAQWSDSLDLAPEYLYFLAFRNDPALAPQFQRWGYR